MVHWSNYKGHNIKKINSKPCYDNTIYTFDIETTSYIIYRGEQLAPIKYLELDEKKKKSVFARLLCIYGCLV